MRHILQLIGGEICFLILSRSFSIAGVLPLALVHSSEDEMRCIPKFPDEENFDYLAFLAPENRSMVNYQLNFWLKRWRSGWCVSFAVVDLGFIFPVESYQQNIKNGIQSFPTWRPAQKR